MAQFDPNHRGYDPSLRPFRLGVYITFFVGLAWFAGAMLWAVVDYLF